MIDLLVSIITAVAAVICAVFTGVATVRASKKQLEQVVLREFLNRRAYAFEQVLLSEADMLCAGYKAESINAFIISIRRATLFSSDDTTVKLLAFQTAATSVERDDYPDVRMDALKAMRRDLMTYEMPKMVRSKSDSSQAKQSPQ